MKLFMKILLAAFIMLVASLAPVYADDDEGNEGANENGSGSDSEDDEKESTPGFEVAFAVAGALAAARLLKARVL
jgi:PGF-CTERM protein